ncbi:MAG TPA: FMN-binding protein [Acidimicrobiia bacterium]|nr:FMN-binding protein [Acidimicrobiia bacterium]
MRRLTAWILGTIAGLVLLVSYHTSTAGPGAPGTLIGGTVAQPAGQVASSPPTASPVSGAGAGASSPPASGSPASGPPASGSGASGSGASATDVVVNGPSVPTRRGPVQVQIHVSNGRLVDVTTLVLPDSNYRDQRINAVAVPILRQEALDAQSANIDGVSGATLTSDGYAASLQAALDSVHLSRS